MNHSEQAMSGIEFMQILRDAGYIPDTATRVILEASVDGVVTLYTSALPRGGDLDKIIDRVLPSRH
jgi:hypothetical protein